MPPPSPLFHSFSPSCGLSFSRAWTPSARRSHAQQWRGVANEGVEHATLTLRTRHCAFRMHSCACCLPVPLYNMVPPPRACSRVGGTVTSLRRGVDGNFVWLKRDISEVWVRREPARTRPQRTAPVGPSSSSLRALPLTEAVHCMLAASQGAQRASRGGADLEDYYRWQRPRRLISLAELVENDAARASPSCRSLSNTTDELLPREHAHPAAWHLVERTRRGAHC